MIDLIDKTLENFGMHLSFCVHVLSGDPVLVADLAQWPWSLHIRIGADYCNYEI